MPTIPPLPQALIPVLPFVALIATDWLRHSTLPRWVNVLIGLFVPLILATIWALLSNALTPDLSGDIALLVALCYAVMALPDIAPLRNWLQSTLTSPAALFASHHRSAELEPAITATAGPAMPYPTPQGIDLRSSRISRIPFDSTFHPMPPVMSTRPMQAVTPSEQPQPTTPVEESPAK